MSDRTCTDCGEPLPDTAGPGVRNHLSCWQNRKPVPWSGPATPARTAPPPVPESEPSADPPAPNPTAHLERALHRPTDCPSCGDLSTAIIGGRCLTCRQPALQHRRAAS